MSDLSLVEISEIVALIFAKYETYPALTINHRYEITDFNISAQNCMRIYLDEDFDLGLLPVSIFDLLFTLGAFQQFLGGPQKTTKYLIQRIHREQIDNPGAADLIAELRQRYPNIEEALWELDISYQPGPSNPTVLKIDNEEYAITSIISSIGVPHDMAACYMRVMSIYPLNKKAELFYQQFADAK